ncbi:MAG TPA: right-handed parallel beta-helix repeat-containing protein [Candidatus Methylacidiphilales bacterium]|nr:right-handed parallel beta-helix repeat-containing protein [Candidatus Methylacidiphilales bacterium]
MKTGTTDTYRISHQGGFPARMLYDDVDLFPYPNLEMLQAFQSPLAPEPRPRPRHGYTYDEASGYLYVRLHPDGKYGSTDPNAHTMAVAPPVAGGFDGTLIRKQADYGIGIMGNGAAFVIIDGITLETPAVAGVFTEGSDVTVRNCWFRGCRTRFSGSYEDRLTDPSKGYEDFFNNQYSPELLNTCAARVVVENCDFTQKPCVDDAAEILALLPDETDLVKLKRGGMAKKGGIYALWIRKDSVNGGLPSEKFKYEIGVADRIGRDWIIRGNYIHNVFEGISCHATSASEGLKVLDNVFEGACDNAIELEDHSVGMVIRGNVLRNCLEPISYQPLRGEPWPHSAVIEKNLIYNAAGDLYAR